MAVSKCVSLLNTMTGASALSYAVPHINESGAHGTPDFPVTVYDDDVTEYAVSWHWHEELEVGFVTNGIIRLECGNRRYLLDQGDIFFINSNVLHSMSNNNPSRRSSFKSIVFHDIVVGGHEKSVFNTKYVLPILSNEQLREISLTKNSDQYQNVYSILDTTWDAVCCETPGYEILVRNRLSDLFCLLVGFPRNDIQSEAGNSVIQEQRVQTILSLICQRYAEDLTLDDLAKSAAISKSEVLRCFKSIVGISPIKYLKEFRLHSAAYMIKNTDYSIGTISALCGFNDNSYFSKVFKEMYLCTPLEYKRNQ